MKNGMGFFRFSFLAAALLAACWNTDKLAGDATETGNAGLTGRMVDPAGAGAAGVTVMAYPPSFDPGIGAPLPDSQIALTDSKGSFSFRKLGFGNYNLYATDPDRGTSNLRTGVVYHGGKAQLDPDTLKPPASLQLPLPENAVAGKGYVYIAGTPVHLSITSAALLEGRIRLDSVPHGTLPAIVCNTDGTDGGRYVIDSGLTAASGQTAVVPLTSLWKNSWVLKLNTGNTGVRLTDTLYNFPLAVRLRSPGFDFQKTQSGGADLRFFKTNGQPLAHEIESWDSSHSAALAWVRIDTLFPGQSGQSIVAFYNNPTAGQAAAAPVFDSAAGFGGVWHMAEEASDTISSGLYRDAVGRNHADDRVQSKDREGVLGNGHSLLPPDYVAVTNPGAGLKMDSTFTLSAWVKTSLASGQQGDVISFGDVFGFRVFGSGNIQAFYYPGGMPDTTAPGSQDYVNAIGGGTTLRDATWHLISATLGNQSLLLFLDGVEVGNQAAQSPIVYHPLLGKGFFVGKHGNGKIGYGYSGNLDEVEVHRKARSAEWIRLMFENQKPSSQFPTP